MLKQSVSRSLTHQFRTTFQPSPITRLPIQRTFRLPKKDNGVLTLNPGKKAFTLLFDGDKLPVQAGVLQAVNVSSVEEANRFLFLLRDTCEIYISPDYRRSNPEVYAEVKAFSYSGVKTDPPFGIETAADLMRKLPFDLKSLMKSPLAITADDSSPCSLDKKFVHKKSDSNVLISEFYSAGKLLYFNMFNDTEELTFDHASDHIQGMLMLEALRQAAVAITHILGLSLDGKLALLSYNTNFFHYLERDTPIVIRAYGSFSADKTGYDREVSVFVQVMQWGKVCAEAELKAFAFMSEHHYLQQKERIEKISSRCKMQFAAKVSRILEAEPSL